MAFSNTGFYYNCRREIILDIDTKIHEACKSGTVEDIRKALQDDRRAINSFVDGLTPLHLAALRGGSQSPDMISLLVEHDADVNAQTYRNEDTALHLVVEEGDFPRDFTIVLALLRNGIDICLRNRKLRTAYDCSVAEGLYELASTLDGSMSIRQAKTFYEGFIDKKYGLGLIDAVLKNDPTLMDECLATGANVNMLNKHGGGAIHYAITCCTLPTMEVLQALVETGGDVNLRDHDNKDAFHLAEERHLHDVMAVLTCSMKLHNPLSEEKYEFSDPNVLNEDGLPPLHVVVTRDNLEDRNAILESLIEKGAKINAISSKEGNTALHMCALRNNVDSATSLLSHGVDCSIKNKERKTAYDLAKEKQSNEVALAIEQHRLKFRKKWKTAGRKAGCHVM